MPPPLLLPSILFFTPFWLSSRENFVSYSKNPGRLRACAISVQRVGFEGKLPKDTGEGDFTAERTICSPLHNVLTGLENFLLYTTILRIFFCFLFQKLLASSIRDTSFFLTSPEGALTMTDGTSMNMQNLSPVFFFFFSKWPRKWLVRNSAQFFSANTDIRQP